jgi:hypothetical protein
MSFILVFMNIKVCETNVENYSWILVCLKQLNAHEAFYFLHNWFSLINLLTNCTFALLLWWFFTRYDECIFDTLGHIVNVKLTEDAWPQATLPASCRGLVIRKRFHELRCQISCIFWLAHLLYVIKLCQVICKQLLALVYKCIKF